MMGKFSLMKKLGFIGIGRMGRPMAERLLAAGYPLTVFNRTPAKAEILVSQGAKMADSPRQVVEQSEITFTMLSDDEAVEAVYLSQPGVMAGLTGDKIIVDCSTISPDLTERLWQLADQIGAWFLDVKILGSVKPAQEGKLVLMVGGEETAYADVLDILKTFGKEIFYLGPAGLAAKMKLSLNIILGLAMQAMAEAVALAEKAGLDRATLFDVLNISNLGSVFTKSKAGLILERNFSPQFSLKLMDKDFRLILNLAKKMQVPLPATAAASAASSYGLAHNKGEFDFSVLAVAMEEMAAIFHPEPQAYGKIA